MILLRRVLVHRQHVSLPFCRQGSERYSRSRRHAACHRRPDAAPTYLTPAFASPRPMLRIVGPFVSCRRERSLRAFGSVPETKAFGAPMWERVAPCRVPVQQQHENGNQHDHDPVPVILAVVRHGSAKAAATSSPRPTRCRTCRSRWSTGSRSITSSTATARICWTSSRAISGRVLNKTRPPLTPRLQKSNCALSLKMRGSRISCGVRHVAPYVMFSLITELELSTL
jgi:hypothetical protein